MYKRLVYIIKVFTIIMISCLALTCNGPNGITPMEDNGGNIIFTLPDPRYDGDISLEQSILNRRSVRTYSDEPLTVEEVSQLLWSAQGITGASGFRSAPSAGALYPLELYAVVGNVVNLEPGIYKYQPDQHVLVLIISGDKRNKLADISLSQESVAEGAVSIVITAVYSRTTVKYGDRGIRYAQLEAGHSAQNLCLQATAMELGVVTIGAFSDNELSNLLNLPDDENPLYVIPVGNQ
jgi:SagB-type dehydrogenase family enzyme